MSRRTLMFSVSVLLITAWNVQAQGMPAKAPQPEPLPAPKTKATIVLNEMPDWPRPGTRAVWQAYGVDARGRLLPRV
ncbi:MAG: hypothetical protein NZO58_07420, partial [Gemmataceae bacterium]|nr:hypothetical protein [Gemmataceae bacterium]